MIKGENFFKVSKSFLKNGMPVLVKTNKKIPQIDVQLWYRVGSKYEERDEKGMAHLVEHLSFKGTKNLSEVDINLITQKLSGYTNAFTTHDYTCYMYCLPRNCLREALFILSDCMQNCTFQEQMLFSEMDVVLQEIKMYRDDYKDFVLGQMLSAAFPEHSYGVPVAGYKQILKNMNREKLYNFYEKYYHPGNATLVVVGDIDEKEVLTQAEKFFGGIAVKEKIFEQNSFFNEDLCQKRMSFYRPISVPFCFYCYKIPGFSQGNSYLFDMISLVLGNGKSSRLYEKLVNEEQLAVGVNCFSLDLFEKSLFFILIYPKDAQSIAKIEGLIEWEINDLIHNLLKDWEFSSAQKQAQIDYTSLLESNDRQAYAIGSSYLATGNENLISEYFEKIKSTNKESLKQVFENYLRSSMQHSGYLLPIEDRDKRFWNMIQEKIDKEDEEILKGKTRTVVVESGKKVNEIDYKPVSKFSCPKPTTFKLDNGLEVLFYNNLDVPQISILLNFKTTHLYDPEELEGVCNFLSMMLLEGTTKHDRRELNKFLESNGIYVSSLPGIISIKALSFDLEKTLEILREILQCPAFEEESIEKVKIQVLNSIQDLLETPIDLADEIAKSIVYKGHPYSKSLLGNKDSIFKINKQKLIDFYEKSITPQQAFFVIVGDLRVYGGKEQLKKLLDKYLGGWKGGKVSNIEYPKIEYSKAEIDYEINRDQVVLTFAAPTVSRLDRDYDAVALLDVIVGGGPQGSMGSRLFELREETGIFYSINASLVYGAGFAPGMALIKTVVSLEKVKQAEKMILDVLNNLVLKGISQEEFQTAKNSLISSSVGFFENNLQTAHVFLFLKKYGFDFNLFDKRGELLSIINIGRIAELASKFCKPENLSIIRIGRKR